MKPNLFLVACPRAGSTQFAHWLSQHPDIFLPPVKEPNHFSAHEFPENFVRRTRLNDVDPASYVGGKRRKKAQFAIFRQFDHYEKLFDGAETKWRLDASTTYLSCADAPEKIWKYDPDARIILLTRDPVERALSHYRLAVRTGRTSAPLADELAAEIADETPLPAQFLVRPSRYSDGIKKFRGYFGEQQCLELSFENLIENPAEVLRQTCGFLGLPNRNFDLRADHQNAGLAPRHHRLNQFLYRSGLKSAFRRLLPNPIKQTLKGWYFNNAKEISISERDMTALTCALKSA